MKQEQKDDLIKKGRKDLVDSYEIITSGFGGILPNGNIVDRRIHPKAIPFQENKLFNTPKPKNIENANRH